MAITSLLTDLDGTLWESASWFAKVVEPDPSDQELIADRLRDPKGGLSAVKLLNAYSISKGKFVKECAAHIQELAVYEGALDTLARVKETARLGVVTSLPAWIAAPMLDELEITGLFDVVQCAQWGMRPKPHPAGLIRALGAMGESSSQALYIGDSQVDQGAAVAAQVNFAWASWGYGRAVDPAVELTRWSDVEVLL